MKFRKHISILSILILLLAMGCGGEKREGHSHDHDNVHDHEHEAHAHEGDTHLESEYVSLSQKQMDIMEIKVGGFKEMELSGMIKSNGRLELPPQNKASLSAIMGGRVEEIHVLQGEFVRRGQVLARMANPEFISIQESYLKASNDLKFHEQEYKRKKTLLADSIASRKSFQEAEAVYKSQLASLNALKAKLELLHIDPLRIEDGKFVKSIPVISPINGYVRVVSVNIGKYVEPMEEMFEIVDNDHIHIDLMVYEKDFGKVKEGQEVIFSLTSNPDSIIHGKIFAVGKSFEEDPRAVLMHAEIDNKTGDLLPGMYVDARIITASKKVQALPSDAIVTDGGLEYIFVRSNNMDPEAGFVFKMVPVKTGICDLGHCEVQLLAELPQASEIVTEGAFYLLAEMNKGEGGHEH